MNKVVSNFTISKIKQINIELFGGCNLSCPMCPQANNGREKEFKKSMNYNLFKKIIDEDPLNEQALVLFAQAILTSDSVQAIKLIESINVGSKYFEAAEAIRTIGLVFQHINEPQSLPEDGVKDSYLNAIREIKANNFERAITELIQIVQKNRNYDNDGARKICVSIFNILGNDNPITKKHRRALSSALF